MATVRSTPTLLFSLTLLLAAAPPPSLAFSSNFRYLNLFSPAITYSPYSNLFSLAHSLITRVANLRAERGDVAGADRARAIADKLEWGRDFGFWKLMRSSGSDYTWLRRWRNELPSTELHDAGSDMNELLRVLIELTRIESGAERSAWVARNYQNVLAISKSLSCRLLKAFVHCGAVREVVETLQIEVVEGQLLRDCLEIGSNDLKALIQVLKDLELQFLPVSDTDVDL